MSFEKVTHVIFDMDGLLIESESIYNKILSEIAASFGKVYDLQLKLRILGTPEPETARIAIEALNLPITRDEFLKVYRQRVDEELTNPVLMPGAQRLVEHLHKHKVPIAVATSSAEDSMKIKTQHHKKLFSLFHHIVCGSTDPEVKHGKPAPDIFLVCASRFPDKPDPSSCLVLEDAPNGVRGARAAGMQAVLVPNEDVLEELRKPATLVLKSLLDFKPELFGLPPFNDCN
ncbi:probable pseudouridine-5'-phosphatase [Coccinella septempunctata]|uniref:probable pseudouridine-5'-phosphatase n=1 Tax=Coccinella septempunctata TaxID=41139 RepID=UPI001D098C4D|nr:probable pseudouridine-5'-phosphatase [Coccinella septempunctata]